MDLHCVEYPEVCFEGYSDKLGMIDQWLSARDHKLRHVPCSPNLEGLHWHMRFHVQPFFGESRPPEIWNTTWVPEKDESRVVLNVDTYMYAAIKDDSLHTTLSGETLRTYKISRISKAINMSSSSEFLEIHAITYLPYDAIRANEVLTFVRAGSDLHNMDSGKWRKSLGGVESHTPHLRRSARLKEAEKMCNFT